MDSSSVAALERSVGDEGTEPSRQRMLPRRESNAACRAWLRRCRGGGRRRRRRPVHRSVPGSRAAHLACSCAADLADFPQVKVTEPLRVQLYRLVDARPEGLTQFRVRDPSGPRHAWL